MCYLRSNLDLHQLPPISHHLLMVNVFIVSRPQYHKKGSAAVLCWFWCPCSSTIWIWVASSGKRFPAFWSSSCWWSSVVYSVLPVGFHCCFLFLSGVSWNLSGPCIYIPSHTGFSVVVRWTSRVVTVLFSSMGLSFSPFRETQGVLLITLCCSLVWCPFIPCFCLPSPNGAVPSSQGRPRLQVTYTQYWQYSSKYYLCSQPTPSLIVYIDPLARYTFRILWWSIIVHGWWVPTTSVSLYLYLCCLAHFLYFHSSVLVS